MIKIFFTKTILVALVVALATLGVASLPSLSASAAGFNDLASQVQISNERLERIWARQLTAYHRLGNTDEFIERVQHLIGRASLNTLLCAKFPPVS